MGGLVLDGFVKAALVDMYGKCGCLERAKEVFDKIGNKSLVSWNAMIGGYSLRGDSVSCNKLLVRMNQEKISPRSTTITSLLGACATSTQLSLIDLYFKCGSVVLAEEVFRMTPKTNLVAWNVMISGYVSTGCYVEALGICDDSRKAGIKPDAITFTRALAAGSQLAALKRGKELHNCIIESKLDSNEIVTGALLDMYAKCGDINEARGIFDQLSTIDLVLWTSMIVAYGSHGQAFEALKLFDKMLKSNLKPDGITFLAVISACSHARLVDEGHHYFNLMVNNYGILLAFAEYSCLVDLLGRAGRLDEAYDILRSSQYIREDVDLLSTLFSACHLHRELKLGEEIAKLLIEKDPDDPSTYIVLEKMYASTKKWDEARKVRLKMKDLGLRNNPGYSWIGVNKSIRTFLVEDDIFTS
ncbi:pentatricopeptide repeat-containing At5g27110 [Olea europaea subsp. europaea]|uniref:Pentatricopeptide repeat-containing At5g27110 n=1 Tax=Olea europaea subsp. europaea TaxID=158383 RepID=A0A8S0S8T4_OLEEU|nr:pentatricopeptide repeat-containing At5g27110 [Olea europaea subsp. europaea]